MSLGAESVDGGQMFFFFIYCVSIRPAEPKKRERKYFIFRFQREAF